MVRFSDPSMVKFSDSDLERITTSITEAEARSSGEIRLVIVSSCSKGIRLASLVGEILVGAMFAYVWWHWEWGHPSPLATLFVGLAPAVLLDIAFTYLLWRPKAVARRVEKRARQEFIRQGVAATADKTGVLILISLHDRHVYLLADTGINAQVPPGTWSTEVTKIIDGLRTEHAADRLCEAIADISDHLALHFPRRPDDQNELPDKPIFAG